METVQTLPEDFPQGTPHHEPTVAEVRATLDMILSSQPFRTSKQCQNLLRYIVEHSLHGDDASLRERILGIQVFGRAADYDTSEDPVVRMRAADVRKRLAQFYQAIEPDIAPVYVELKSGSYRATFRYEHAAREDSVVDATPDVATLPFDVQRDSPALGMAAPALQKENPPARRHWPGFATGIAAVVLLVILGAAGWRELRARSVTAQQRFWAPLTQFKQPILLYLGSNVAYRFTPEYLARYQREHDLKENGPEFFVDLPKGGIIKADDLQPIKDTFVTVGDLAASTQIVSLMNSWGKPFVLRSAADVSMGDLRNNPAVLLGGFNNPWTLETTNDLRYAFRDGTRIEDREDPGHKWSVSETHKGATEDYALISRLLHSNTGGPVLVIGGIGSFGTQAAAEFVSSPEKMNDLLKSAPAGWENKNMQAVLRVKVVGYAPVAVDVVAISYW